MKSAIKPSADIVIKKSGIVVIIYGIPLSEVAELQEKIADIGATSVLESNASGGHYMELTANSTHKYPVRRCVCQPATQTAEALYAFCRRTLRIPQERVGITV